MKVTYNWLKEFVDIKVSPEKLSELLTMAGLEVVSLERKGQDAVLEIEITSNRPDWLSIIGVAREVAAITGAKLKLPQASSSRQQAKTKSLKHAASGMRSTAIVIDDKKDCPLYTAKIIRGVKVGPSPRWLKERLELLGCRSINNVVDITNYVLFEYGEPLHAFDMERLNGNCIKVRRAQAGERIVTIDGITRLLDKDILVIADEAGAVALAGVMGGKDAEVGAETKDILLEAAIFNPILIRRARQKLGIQTDSSYRFERGIDRDTAESASLKAVRLIIELCGGTVEYAEKNTLPVRKAGKINFSLSSVERVLGMALKENEIKNILVSLGCSLTKKSKDRLIVKVPSHRTDLQGEVDLIEELARIYGFDRIPTTIPKSRCHFNADLEKPTSLIEQVLLGLGLYQANTYSLIPREMLSGFGSAQEQLVALANPLSREQEILRPTLIPGLLRCVSLNLNQKQEAVMLFEIAHVFGNINGRINEESRLAIVLCGTKNMLTTGGLLRDTLGLLHLKGIIQTVCDKLGVEALKFSKDDTGIGVYIGTEQVGLMRVVPADILGRFDIKNKEPVCAELFLDKILKSVRRSNRFLHLPQYPAIYRDISLVVKNEVSVAELLEEVKKSSGELLKCAKIIDFYKGKQVPPQHQGLTISCLYRSDTRTLTEEEVALPYTAMKSKLTEKFGAQFR